MNKVEFSKSGTDGGLSKRDRERSRRRGREGQTGIEGRKTETEKQKSMWRERGGKNTQRKIKGE